MKEIKTIEEIEKILGKNFKSWIDKDGKTKLISNKDYLEWLGFIFREPPEE
jgi:hypothetical protein